MLFRSEGAIAKRRAGATLVSYLSPTVEEAGLYSGLLDLKTSIDRWRNLGPDDREEQASLATLIQAQAAAIDLLPAEPVWEMHGDPAQPMHIQRQIEQLSAQMLELEYTLIPHGLHVVGKPYEPTQLTQMLQAMADSQGHGKVAEASIEALVKGRSASQAAEQIGRAHV